MTFRLSLTLLAGVVLAAPAAAQDYGDLGLWKEVLETQLVPQGNNLSPSDSSAMGGIVVLNVIGHRLSRRRMIEGGQWPPADAVRLEELVNYFGYDDPTPAPDDPLPF